LITFQSHPYSFRLKLFKIRTHDLKNIPFYLEVKDKNPIFAIVSTTKSFEYENECNYDTQDGKL
jgi:hypothetical protein